MSRYRKLLVVTLPVLVLTGVLAAAAIEAWVRLAWDPRRGMPGFFLTDASRGQRLAPSYSGWFAGVPVQTNRLGLRDAREYALEKGPTTFRILILGDSVTFGHGAIHPYPALLEQRLRAWRPDVDWQVWNAAVPGYNTAQELAQLLEDGPSFAPDLVVVGFYENDLIDNVAVYRPGPMRRVGAAVLSFARRHVYSFELYKRAYLELAWRFTGRNDYRLRVQHLASEESLIARNADTSAMPQQQITDYDWLSDDAVAAVRCVYGMKPNPETIPMLERDPEFAVWREAVRGFQQLAEEHRYRIVFFVNYVPPVCPDGDVFYDGGSKALNDFYLRILSDGTPAVSVYDAFLHTRPSQMPNARAHAFGNANDVKAAVLFAYLKSQVLPAALRSSLGHGPG